ncbi:hypothetical protein M2454_002753, partial [Aequitasia blattaphilus]
NQISVKNLFIADRQVNQFISLPIEEGEFLMFLLNERMGLASIAGAIIILLCILLLDRT